MGIEGLINIERISARAINKKKSLEIFKTCKPKQREELELEGWKFVPSKLKHSIRMSKPKSHDIYFEDRVWALFAKMGFKYLNEDRNFKIEYQEGLKKQIDIFAADEEAILIVECKSCETKRRVNYQKDINELIELKEKIRRAAKKLISENAKVAFVFATNKSILNENDRKRLEEDSIFHFNQDDFEYYETITDHLGAASKFQLFGRLFAGHKIPGLKTRVPAIKGKMASGDTFYSFGIEPDFLLKIGFMLHRIEPNKETSMAYQRLVKKSRLNKIAKYIDNGGYFPNSIIINIITGKRKKLKFDEAEKIPHDSYTSDGIPYTSYGILHLPQTYRSVFIIDGQHRLYGYSKAKYDSNHTIPVVAFHNMRDDEQAKIFVKINQTQKSVPANLIESIMSDFNWGSDNERLALRAVRTRTFIEMNNQDFSPFYKRIISSEEKKTDIRCLTLKSILDWGINKTNFFGIIKNDKLIKTGYLNDVSYEKTLKKSLCFFNACFSKIENELEEQWDLGREEGGFIAMNIGVSAIIRTLDSLLEHLEKNKNIVPQKMEGKELADLAISYLDPVIEFVKILSFEERKKFRGYFGSGATEKVQREFQSKIHEEFKDFNPDGLDQWIKESSGQFTNLSFALGNQKIQPLIDKFIKQKLVREYGEKKWWTAGVPFTVRKPCVIRKEQESSSESPWKFLDIIHYKEIINYQWNLLGDFFTPPGMEQASRKSKLSWLDDINSIRNKYSHPSREKVTEKEYNDLEEIYEWLQKKLVDN